MSLLKSALVLVLCALNLSQEFLVRKSVESLSSEELLDLHEALQNAVEDNSSKGYASIAAYHGYPAQCSAWGLKLGCSVHGVSIFPQWHRLYVVQMEQAFQEKGLTIGVPYWDWTRPLVRLPGLVSQLVFTARGSGKAKRNAWYQGHIVIGDQMIRTARSVDKRLFQKYGPGEHTNLFEHVLNALEYKDYNQFEVQLEIAQNTIHHLVGGRNKYSMSNLDYASYDPIFFLHHANVDRIYTIYERLYGSARINSFDVQTFMKPMDPFSWETNPFNITKDQSKPKSTFTFKHSPLGYKYQDLTLNGLDSMALQKLIKERKKKPRAFAVFRLNSFRTSAEIKVQVCIPTSNAGTNNYCEYAGAFFLLGGPLEMPWAFSNPYYFEVTKTVQRMKLPLDGNYRIEAEIYSVNGARLPDYFLPHPFVSFRPGSEDKDPPIQRSDVTKDVTVRKDVDRLSREEVLELRRVMQNLQKDKSVEGYQAMAEFHGNPGMCPHPTSQDRKYCSNHGQPSFPHWHRLMIVQLEDALRKRGSPIGVPYWDWTKLNTSIPLLAADPDYIDPYSQEKQVNPFYQADIEYLNVTTGRDASLDQTISSYNQTELFEAFLLALEQEDFCDFEIQFEMAHNLIHSLVGGRHPYSMATLEYSAFDPIFYLHHSGMDRIWAIWTALQELRGKPYKAHCAQSYTYTPMKPFAFSSPYNNNNKTSSHSVPTKIYDYESELNYAYDSLRYGGMNVAELNSYILKRKTRDRVFAGFLLWGIKTTGIARIFIQAPEKRRIEAGRFAILGGPGEMQWRIDRLYKYEITDALTSLGLGYEDDYKVTFEIKLMDGSEFKAQFPFPEVKILFQEASDPVTTNSRDSIKVRQNVETLTSQQVYELRKAMTALQAKRYDINFQILGRYHGGLEWCPFPKAKVKKLCGRHGVATFPHWHRLWTVLAENALRNLGYTGALPYWDWTRPLTALPDLVSSAKYLSPISNEEESNPFHSAFIKDVNESTTRSLQENLFKQPAYGEYTAVSKQVLLAMEQEDFCDFEVQFEIAHNFINAHIGGFELYSMSSLKYAAFDPLFVLHHANVDRIWAIWQALQKLRNKPYLTANCAQGLMQIQLSPYNLTDGINRYSNTKGHSEPSQVFDYRPNFNYDYDNLDFNGLTVSQLFKLLEKGKARDRVFVGFKLHSLGQSVVTKVQICSIDSSCHAAGEFYILGDQDELEWSYDRLYKHEITDQLRELGLRYDDQYTIKYTVSDLQGKDMGRNVFLTTSVMHQLGTDHWFGKDYREQPNIALRVRRNLKDLSSGDIESLRAALLSLQQDGTYEDIATFHGKPGLCTHGGRSTACCSYGSATFPAWNRLYVKQVEDALLDRGSSVAVPYWDWTTSFSKLPKLLDEATYYNWRKQRFEPNPFFGGRVKGENAFTTRDPQAELFNNKDLYEQALYVLEQDHFCDFEIQFEVFQSAIHFLVGGRSLFSLSSLDYSAFDPVFILHRTNTDRIWAIWQELQRYRRLPYSHADCAINKMKKHLEPFDRPELNKNNDTAKFSRPADTFDYRNHFDYAYDSLEFNRMTIPQLETLLQKRKTQSRVFAGFLLHSFGLSVKVDLYLCTLTDVLKMKKSCDNKAGTFYVLGGEIETPFSFDRLYKHDITNAVRALGFELDSAANFELKVDISAANGSVLSQGLRTSPSIIYEPGGIKYIPGQQSNQLMGPLSEKSYTSESHVINVRARKEVQSLNPREILSLYHAMASLQQDNSPDGWQALAAFHALPTLCPNPRAEKRYVCSPIGTATFLPWHRLYTVQVEDALRRHGALVGLPYWDWTREGSELPEFLEDDNYHDPLTGKTLPNPFVHSKIGSEGVYTDRDILVDKIFKMGPHGWDTWMFEQALFALEQDNYCDFQAQLEVISQVLSVWIGGSETHSMSHLHFASYDPLFFVHHANVDRLWAVWQALQKHRGHDPDKSNCALEMMKKPLKPFSFGSPYNLNEVTKEKSLPTAVFKYETNFHYRYDNLEFAGMSVSQLDAYIKGKTKHDRVFAGFLLNGLRMSAFVDFEICTVHKCTEGGYFAVLGGAEELPWQFDRLYKYDITQQLKSRALRFDDDYEIKVHVKSMNGSQLSSSLIGSPNIIFVPAKEDPHLTLVTPNLIRRDLSTLTERDFHSLRVALQNLQQDQTDDGWARLASFHGAPACCKDEEGNPTACSAQGLPTFPHWHRLFTLQIEHALKRHGSAIAVPYWDWTFPTTELPSIFTEEDYYDILKDEVVPNPFVRGYIPTEDTYTVRDVRHELFTNNTDNSQERFEMVLLALEQIDFCDFAAQFQVVHSTILNSLGGDQLYSLSTLEYSAYDPIFIIHNSFMDKIWLIWQELQKERHLPSLGTECALNYLNQPLQPFNSELNMNTFTKEHSLPKDLFNHDLLGYQYDHLKIGGHSVNDLEYLINDKKMKNRILAGFLLKSVNTSVSVKLHVCNCQECSECIYAGGFSLLGGPTERTWAFDHLFKKDITHAVEEAGIEVSDSADFFLDVKVYDRAGKPMKDRLVFPTPSIILVPTKGF
ncbi:hemocyanin 1-like isoform X3 [Biomphalaria glabrata]|uniref:Hemocyanin 1-like isoform X3 n=1 Tax=Biomphalaria glabrata TaxID=6526 RepID=A0A9W3B308_BIOGL|nr:hemocyanin 1-like isoform X3 [Biomphalaria glabrata]